MQSSGAAADGNCIGHSEMGSKFLFKLLHFPAQLHSVVPKRRAIAQHTNRGFYFLLTHKVDAREFQRQRFGTYGHASVDRKLLRFRFVMACTNFFFVSYGHKSPMAGQS